jgi:hypothetical protein
MSNDDERGAGIESVVASLIEELSEERRIEFLVELIVKNGGDIGDPKFFEKLKKQVVDERFEAVKNKLASDAIEVLGKGSRTDGDHPCDWVLVKTPKDTITVKQYWTGQGLAVETSIWSHLYITDEEASLYGEDMGYFLEIAVKEIPEPIGFRYCSEL